MALVRTHTRTHVSIELANPHLACDTCHKPVRAWHDNERCGCDANNTNEPCGHKLGFTSACPSWGPVDGCTCKEPRHV